MKTVLIFAGLVALALATAPTPTIKTKAVDNVFVERQRKILGLFESAYQLVEDAEYYIIGKEYNIEANIENYTNKKAVEEFLLMYRTGFMPKEFEFSVFYENMRDEAISLFHVFYYAKDFETFYKTAAFAKVHLNEGQFLYALYIAVLQRTDTHGLVMPAPYEIYPQYFASKQMFTKAFFTKMQKDEGYPNFTKRYNIAKVEDKWVFYSNYSNSLTYPNEEVRLSYFTEDIELNSYYYNFHSHLPFWWNANKYPVFKERRGEIYFHFYQQLLARYYLERLTNGLGGIPEFSWFSEFKTGYFPPLTAFYLPYAQRSNGYDMHSEMNYERIRFLDTYEKTFFQYLQSGQFKAFEKEIDFHNPKALNFVGNYWQTNADLYSEESTKDFQHSYEIAARRVLGAAPALNNKYIYVPSALDNYQTSLRDPAFYQLYQRIVDYMIEFKEYLIPYTKQDLAFKGVEVTEVKVDKLVTFFEYFDFNITNRMYFTKEELKTEAGSDFMVRQPRLNHQPFLVTVDVKSEVATDAVVKFFLGPKYDSNGQQLSLEQDWMKFYELDWSVQKLVPGENKITRVSNDFTSFKDEFVPMSKVKTYLDEGKVPYDMSEDPDKLTRRLMLPRGTAGGYPFQLFVFVYPYKASTQKEEMTFMNYIMDNKPFGYPLDRPLQEINFQQPNAYFKQVNVYHEGSPYYYNSEVSHYFNTIYSQLGKKHA